MELSPDQWRKRLLAKYRLDITYRSAMQAIYESRQPTVPVLDRYREAYTRLIAMSRTPWPRLVVDIVAERMTLQGFTGTDNTNDLWEILKSNRIEAMQKQVHREAVAIGTSYVSVWEDEDADGLTVAYESGLTVTHETAPGDPHTVAAAIKVWHDTIEGKVKCNVYLPDGVYKWQSTEDFKDAAALQGKKLEELDWTGTGTVTNPYEVVTIVPFVVRPDWVGYGRSDLQELEPVLARIESQTLNTNLAIELGAFRQKWATGLEIPLDEDNNPVEPFKVALDRLWVSEDEDTKFGSFDYTDVRPYLQAISDSIGQLSAVSRIPTLYFQQSELSNPPSAASLEASETGLINKVQERIDRFAESWEAVAHLVIGDADDPNSDLGTLWKDPRTQSDAQTVDAAVKLISIGVPWAAVMEYLGYTPEQIKVMESQRAADTFNQLLATAQPRATALETGQATETPAQADE